MDCSMPGFLEFHNILQYAQTHVHCVCDAIQSSHPLSPPFPPAFKFSQALRSFSMSWLFASGDQSVGTSDSASVLPMNSQDWFLLGLTSLISLLTKGLSWIFSSTVVQKHEFFGTQSSLRSCSHILPWKTITLTRWPFVCTKWCLCFVICCLGLS